MNFLQFFKNPAFAKAPMGKQKFYLTSSAVILIGLFFILTASPAWACEKHQESYFSYFNSAISFINETIKGLGFDVSLAAAPDPDFCGSDNVICSGTPSAPTATISWTAAPATFEDGNQYIDTLMYYILNIAGVGSYNVDRATPYYTVPSGLENNTTYNWSVEAIYYMANAGYNESTTNLVSYFPNPPFGSFTTPNCAPPPGDFSLSLGGSVACNSVPLSWTAASDADAYRILKGAARVDISPYQPYTALNFTDTTVSENTTYLYQIEAYNASGTNRSNTKNVDTPYCPPIISFSANPTSIFQGQTSTLSWSSSYATSCVASGGWSGSKALNGSEVVIPSPPPSATYNLNCSGPGGSALGSATINISPLLLPDWKEIIPR